MEAYVTEQQQIEHLKRWLKKHGTFLLACIVAVCIATCCVQMWQKHREKVLNHASDHYEWLLDSIFSNTPSVAQAQANYIQKRYANTPYALMASLMQARQAVYDNDLVTAESKLAYVLQHTKNVTLREVTRIRLARVLAAENKLDRALEVLNTVDDKTYLPVISTVKGDILVSKGELDSAKESYRLALRNLNDTDSLSEYVQMKLDDISTNADAARLTTT